MQRQLKYTLMPGMRQTSHCPEWLDPSELHRLRVCELFCSLAVIFTQLSSLGSFPEQTLSIYAGKGRGAVASRDIAVGEAILVTPPAAIVRSQLQQRPFAEQVVDKVIDEQLYTSRWFDVLYDGSIKSTKLVPGLHLSSSDDDASTASHDAHANSSCPEPILASTSAPAAAPGKFKAGANHKAKSSGFAPKAGQGSSGPGSSLRERLLKQAGTTQPDTASSGAHADVGRGQQQQATAQALSGLDKQSIRRLAKLVKFNCFGDEAGDLAACAARGEAVTGHIGLWPEFALLNHSCVPNAVNYVIG